MKIKLNDLFKKNPFLVNKIEKKIFFNNLINNLNLHHFQKCKEYREVIDSLNCNIRKNLELKECPALPINLFKEFDLMSIQKKQIVKKIFSSGTSSNRLSKIYLDKENSINQIKALSSIMQNSFGKERLPMLIVSSDPKKTLKNNFNAKYAAILGFSIFGKEHTYVLDELGNFDFVVPVIESGNTYGQAFAAASGKMFKDVVRKPERNVRYFLRAKIEKEHKYSVDDLMVRGKDILATDDSLVRGDTIVEFYASLKKAGAKTVSFMIAWPPIFFACNNGIDTPTHEELYAHKLIERGFVEYNGGEIKYDVHRINDMITGLLREDIKREYPEINPNDLYVYYGTNEILAESLHYKQKCSFCHTGVPPK